MKADYTDCFTEVWIRKKTMKKKKENLQHHMIAFINSIFIFHLIKSKCLSSHRGKVNLQYVCHVANKLLYECLIQSVAIMA